MRSLNSLRACILKFESEIFGGWFSRHDVSVLIVFCFPVFYSEIFRFLCSGSEVFKFFEGLYPQV